ncbi:MAG TPA: pyridoxal-dependent decarboxylase [Desulfotignum sp.]|nr:pyridoxal-dependent decarboxylase [Desulfotignum sp.]
MTFTIDGKQVLAALDRYLEESRQAKKPVIHQETIETIHTQLDLAAIFREGGLSGSRLDRFLSAYLDNTTRLHHPGYLAHQVGNPQPLAALGSFIDGVTNNAMAIYEMGPAAAAIEFFMVNQLLDRVGWPHMPFDTKQRLTVDHGAGVLTHGGSLANMTALMTARNHLDPALRENGCTSDLVLLAPDSCHYSVTKTAGILGMGEKNVVLLPTDRLGRVLPDRAERTISQTLKAGRRIVALIANACATGTGLFDPIDRLADICRKHSIWFHVDGAHGGSLLFSKKYRHLLAGLEKADSLILDAHKMLQTPTVCAALLVKHAATLDHAFQHDAGYLFHEKYQPGFDFISQTVECTKAGLGLRFFLAFAAQGEAGMAEYIDTCIDLTCSAQKYIASQPDFDVPYTPESNILCFRHSASETDQLAIRDRLIQKGNFYLSSTSINDQRFLRMVIISPATTLDDIKALVHAIRQAAETG